MNIEEWNNLTSPQRWVIERYPNLANHPVNASRSIEYEELRRIAVKYYGIALTEQDFDIAISIRFGDGVEYEWPRD